MQTLQRPYWLLLTQTLCALILTWMFYDAYDTIHTQLSAEAKATWQAFAAILISFSVFSLGYAVFRIRQRAPIALWYNVSLVATQVLLLVLFLYYYNNLFPFSIPKWMLPGNMSLLGITFLMPGIVHGMLNLASRPLKSLSGEAPFQYLLLAAAVPFTLYLGSLLLVNFGDSADFIIVAVPITFWVGVTLLFSYTVTRGLYLFAVKNTKTFTDLKQIASFGFTVLLPITGLLANQFLFQNGVADDSGIFGNFSHPATYVLAALNGLFLSVPFLRRPTLPFFLIRATLFSFSLYFFLVFLPFLPLSLLAIILVGIGLLMLAPLVVFVLHATKLSQDYTALRSRYRPATLWLGGAAAFLLIPAVITGLFLVERSRFHEALDYVYAPDYHREYQLDAHSVTNTLHYLRQHKGEVGFSKSTPYLSAWYNHLVLGRQTLTDSRIEEMEHIFSAGSVPETRPPFRNTFAPPKTATLQALQTSSRYDAARRLWVSDLTLKLHSNEASESVEYTTDVELPAGCAVSDYYLYINGRKELGMLAEKKSALWVFNNIVNITRRDPGIVYYTSPNRIRLRVFPVLPEEVRSTGLQLIHPEPVSLLIDGRTVQLGLPESKPSQTPETDHFALLSSADVSKLPRQVRKPYFHFLVDAHDGNTAKFTTYATDIRDLMTSFPQLGAGAQLSLVSSVVQTQPYQANWAADFGKQPFTGGFFLERALRQSLVNSYEAGTDRYPVFVVCTSSLSNAVLPPDFTDLQFCVPEDSFFYHLTPGGRLLAHSFRNTSRGNALVNALFPPPVTPVRVATLGNRKVYLPDESAPAFILKKPLFETDSLQPYAESAALTLEALNRSSLLHPDHTDVAWKVSVRASTQAHVLSPATAFMVVENEAQRQVLRKKQAAMLSGKAALSAGEAEEEPERMSEPDVFVVLGLLSLVLLLVRHRKRRLNHAA